MKLRVGKRAEQQVEKIDAWWQERRPAAPALFLQELTATFDYICERKNAGVRWGTPRRPNLRRILMPRTNHHVYFVCDESADVVQVYAVWGAPKGRTPRL